MRHFAKTALAVAVSASCFAVSAEQLSATGAVESDIEKIIVSGQKIANTLQDTKESVVVYTLDDMEKQNLEDLTDLYLQTAGVSGDQFGFRIRGVRNTDGATQPNRGDLASVVIDNVTVSGWVTSEGVGQLWDVAQVEVLRGPQSTNLGRNALAGAVVLNTQNPVYENEFKFRSGFGQYNQSEYKGVANFNIVDGVSAIRFAAESNHSDGYVTNITRNEDDFGSSKNKVYRLKWLYEPSDDLKSVFSYQRVDNAYGATSNYLIDGYTAEDRVISADEISLYHTKANLASLTVDYTINEFWHLTSITGYQDGNRDRFNDYDQTASQVGSGGGIVTRYSEDKNWSQEFRFNYDGDGLRGSSGVYFAGIEAYRTQTNQIDLNLSALFDDFFPGLGQLLTTTDILPLVVYQPFYDTQQSGTTDVDTSIWAAFTEWEYDINEQWTVNFGARYDNEKQDFATATSNVSTYQLPQTGGPLGAIPVGQFTVDSLIGLINPQLLAYGSTVPETEKSESFNNFLPHAGITYNWNDDVSSSFFVKKSYRSGGSELTLFNGINNFDAEELWNYETSLRAVVMGGKGVINANAYYSDWTDQQVAIQEPGTSNRVFTMTINAGESELFGAEVNFNYELTKHLEFYTSLALSKTEYKEFKSPDGQTDFSGQSFERAPEKTGAIGLYYSLDNGFFLNSVISYTDSSFARLGDMEQMDSYTLVNINSGYEWDNVKVEAYVRNLFDEVYEQFKGIQAGDGTPGVTLGAPRVAGARVTVTF